MSKQPNPPPPGDKPVPTAPPPPPAWRHWLWPIALLTMLVLYIYLYGHNTTSTVSLPYSTFLSDASSHKKTAATRGSSPDPARPRTVRRASTGPPRWQATSAS